MFIHKDIYICTYTHIYVYIYMCVYVYICEYIIYAYVHTYLRVHTYIQTYKQNERHTYVHIKYKHTDIYMYIGLYKHTRTHIPSLSHTHTTGKCRVAQGITISR